MTIVQASALTAEWGRLIATSKLMLSVRSGALETRRDIGNWYISPYYVHINDLRKFWESPVLDKRIGNRPPHIVREIVPYLDAYIAELKRSFFVYFGNFQISANFAHLNCGIPRKTVKSWLESDPDFLIEYKKIHKERAKIARIGLDRRCGPILQEAEHNLRLTKKAIARIELGVPAKEAAEALGLKTRNVEYTMERIDAKKSRGG